MGGRDRFGRFVGVNVGVAKCGSANR